MGSAIVIEETDLLGQEDVAFSYVDHSDAKECIRESGIAVGRRNTKSAMTAFNRKGNGNSRNHKEEKQKIG